MVNAVASKERRSGIILWQQSIVYFSYIFLLHTSLDRDPPLRKFSSFSLMDETWSAVLRRATYVVN